MGEKLLKFILQIIILICITVLACVGIFDADSIGLVFGTIIGYAFATAKDAYINKD
jgi:xanthine/uracil permease